MFNTILKIISFFFLAYGLYYVATGVFAFIKPKKDKLVTNKKHKFSIIVAARNEEGVIGNLIDSLQKQNYDKDKYEINIIVNNSTDNTYKVCKKYKINVIKCDVPVKNKGDVLRYTFKKFKDKKFDAYLVFDADNVVHPDFLLHMNNSLNCGYKVAQGFRDSKNYKDNWISGSYTLFYYIQNFFFNLSRKKLNSSASINGTGFMIRKDFIDKLDYNPVILTEDVELTTVCAINNERVDFVKDAITYDEQPTRFKVSLTQRLRWSKGNLQCWMKYHHMLFKTFIKHHNLAAVDMYLNNLAAIVQVLSVVVALASLIERMVVTEVVFSFAGIVGVLVSYIATIILTLFVTIYNKKSISGMLPALILFSLFMMSWIPINVVCLFKKNLKWHHIGHNKDINIDDIIKSS